MTVIYQVGSNYRKNRAPVPLSTKSTTKNVNQGGTGARFLWYSQKAISHNPNFYSHKYITPAKTLHVCLECTMVLCNFCDCTSPCLSQIVA